MNTEKSQFDPAARSPQLTTGFSLVEVLVVIAVVAILAGMALPSYGAYRERADEAIARADIQQIENAIERFGGLRMRFPESLSDLDLHNLEDPWGNTYRYRNIEATAANDKNRGLTVRGKKRPNLRRDRTLKSINSDYDLYSMGKDGDTKPHLNAKVSRDDIVRAADGRFVGRGENF